jgi:hypothetical protein
MSKFYLRKDVDPFSILPLTYIMKGQLNADSNKYF